jgi:hypothetical protein
MKCIYCKKEHTGKIPEHIIPESLGCPTNAILHNGEVCTICNLALGHKVDVHLKDAFDFLIFLHGIPRKKGKLPIIASRGNCRAEYINGGPYYFFNNSPKNVIASDGKVLPALKMNNSRHIKSKVQIKGDKGTVNFSINIGDNIGFVQAIFKIAT